MNSVNLMGNMVRDPEKKQGSNSDYVKFTLAVNRLDKDAEPDFIPCIAFGKVSDVIEKYVKKGDRLGATGTLQTHRYEKDGENRTSFYVIVNTVDLPPKKNGGSKKGNGGKW